MELPVPAGGRCTRLAARLGRGRHAGEGARPRHGCELAQLLGGDVGGHVLYLVRAEGGHVGGGLAGHLRGQCPRRQPLSGSLQQLGAGRSLCSLCRRPA